MSQSWTTDLVSNFLNDCNDSILDGISFLVDGFFVDGEKIIQKADSEVTFASSSAAMSIVIFFTVYTIFKTYIMETDGDSESDPLGILVKLAQSIAIIWCNSFFIDWILALAHGLSEKITSKFMNPASNIIDVVGFGQTVFHAGIFLTLLGIAYTICIIVLIYKACLRGGELLLMKILFPFMAIDLISQNKERWSAFLTSFMVAVFGYIPQLICFRISCAQIMTPQRPQDIVVGFTMIILAIKTPKWLEKFCYKSGITQTVSSGLRTMAFVAPRFMGK